MGLQLAAAIFLVLLHSAAAYTEVFDITKGDDGFSYYVGHVDSDFFVGKKANGCDSLLTSSAGSTTGDNDNDANNEILYGVVYRDGLIYSAGTTKGVFDQDSEETERPNLDIAIVVYNEDLTLNRRRQYDLAGLDNVGSDIAISNEGTLLVSVYGASTNAANLFDSRLIEMNPTTLDLVDVHDLNFPTSLGGTGGGKVSRFFYESETNTVVCYGNLFGIGLVWRYDLATRSVVSSYEFNSVLGFGFQVGSITSNEAGVYYVVGSSELNINNNQDLTTTSPTEFHTFLIKLTSTDGVTFTTEWTRQLASSAGSSQTGNDVTIEPNTGEIIVIGTFDNSFTFTDSQTGQTFTVNEVTGGDAGNDIFLWAVSARAGDTTSLGLSESASTASEDRGNAVQVNSGGEVEIGGMFSDGGNPDPTVCDSRTLVPSASPSASATPSATAALVPSASASIAPSASAVPDSSVSPSVVPSAGPSADPAAVASADPAAAASADPVAAASADPVAAASADPAAAASADPAAAASADPAAAASADPAAAASADPAAAASVDPAAVASADPAPEASADPAAEASADPVAVASADPASAASVAPSAGPLEDPSADSSPAAPGDPSADPSADSSADPSAISEPEASVDAVPNSSADPVADPDASASALPSAPADVSGDSSEEPESSPLVIALPSASVTPETDNVDPDSPVSPAASPSEAPVPEVSADIEASPELDASPELEASFEADASSEASDDGVVDEDPLVIAFPSPSASVIPELVIGFPPTTSAPVSEAPGVVNAPSDTDDEDAGASPEASDEAGASPEASDEALLDASIDPEASAENDGGSAGEGNGGDDGPIIIGFPSPSASPIPELIIDFPTGTPSSEDTEAEAEASAEGTAEGETGNDGEDPLVIGFPSASASVAPNGTGNDGNDGEDPLVIGFPSASASVAPNGTGNDGNDGEDPLVIGLPSASASVVPIGTGNDANDEPIVIGFPSPSPSSAPELIIEFPPRPSEVPVTQPPIFTDEPSAPEDGDGSPEASEEIDVDGPVAPVAPGSGGSGSDGESQPETPDRELPASEDDSEASPESPDDVPEESAEVEDGGLIAPEASAEVEVDGPIAPEASAEVEVDGPIAPEASAEVEVDGPIAPEASAEVEGDGPIAPEASAEVEVDGPIAPEASNEDEVEPSPEASAEVEVDGPVAPTAPPTLPPGTTTVTSPGSITQRPPISPSICNPARMQNVSLLPTRNFQRVEMQVQIVGTEVTDRCGFTASLLETFIRLSAENTDSLPELWYVTGLRDGPPVTIPNLEVVLVTPAPSAEPSPSPSSLPDNGSVVISTETSDSSTETETTIAGTTFDGSAIFNITAFLDPLSTELVFGSYVNYIESQQIVAALNQNGQPGVQWVGLLTQPLEVANDGTLDKELDTNLLQGSGSSGVSGIVSGVIVGVAILAGLTGLVVLETMNSSS